MAKPVPALTLGAMLYSPIMRELVLLAMLPALQPAFPMQDIGAG